MASLASYIRSRGLKMGIYTDVTTSPCIHGQYDRERGVVPGSWGHYTTDASTFARWGIEYVKADFCHDILPNGTTIDAEEAYTQFSRALNATGKQIYFLACYDRWVDPKHPGGVKPGVKPPWQWMHSVANAYRLGSDHHDDWQQLLAEIQGNAHNAQHSVAGSFGDWDALITGGAGCVDNSTTPPPSPPHTPCQGPGAVNCGPQGDGPPGVRCPHMTEAEYRTSFSIWVLGASPLMIDADIRNLTSFQSETLLHDEVLEIHADPAAHGGSRIGCTCAKSGGGRDGSGVTMPPTRTPAPTPAPVLPCGAAGGEVWAKRLAGNETAVALFNLREKPQTLAFSFALLGYDNGTELSLRDVWARTDLGKACGTFRTAKPVPAHGTLILRVAHAAEVTTRYTTHIA